MNQSKLLKAQPMLALMIFMIALGAIVTYAQNNEASKATESTITKPKVIAVKFHADWCKGCQKIDAVKKQVAKGVADQPILFVQFDLTNAQTRKQSQYLAAALGLGDVYRQYGKKTGFVLLVDAQRKNVIDKLTYKQSAPEMIASLNQSVSQSQIDTVEQAQMKVIQSGGPDCPGCALCLSSGKTCPDCQAKMNTMSASDAKCASCQASGKTCAKCLAKMNVMHANDAKCASCQASGKTCAKCLAKMNVMHANDAKCASCQASGKTCAKCLAKKNAAHANHAKCASCQASGKTCAKCMAKMAK